MLPSPAPRYYLVGVLLSCVGGLVLWLRGLRGGKSIPRSWVAIAAGIVLILAGVAVVGVGISIDVQYYTGLNTTVLDYDVSVQVNESWPVRIVLPAPVEPRFFSAMNATNGSATMRLNHTATDTNVVITAFGNITFRIRTSVPTAEVNAGFTRLNPSDQTPCYPGCNATIEVSGVPSGETVFVSLNASIGVVCENHSLSIAAWVREGVGQYPAVNPTTVC